MPPLSTGVAQLVEHRSPKPSVESSSLSARALLNDSWKMKIVDYVKESYTELKEKVSWPTWKELRSSVLVVSIASLIIALAVFLMDISFKNLLELFYRNVHF